MPIWLNRALAREGVRIIGPNEESHPARRPDTNARIGDSVLLRKRIIKILSEPDLIDGVIENLNGDIDHDGTADVEILINKLDIWKITQLGEDFGHLKACVTFDLFMSEVVTSGDTHSGPVTACWQVSGKLCVMGVTAELSEQDYPGLFTPEID